MDMISEPSAGLTSQSRQIEQLQRMVAAFAHAAGNSLFAVNLDLYTLRKLAGECEISAPLRNIIDLVTHCERQLGQTEKLISELVDLVSSAPPLDRAICLNESLARAVDAARARGASVIVQGPTQPDLMCISADDERLDHAWEELLCASYGVCPAGEVAVQATVFDEDAVISIGHREWPLSETDRQRIFEPFLVIDGQPQTGLARARKHLVEAGGEVECRAGRQGVEFVVSLPLHISSPAR
jgi:signal transduction histidine kinase